VPASAWTNARLIARGKQIYVERCAVCHGDSGDGNGPASAALPLKPPDLRDGKMVGEMTGSYWFWRVSEGGVVDPFQSAGSVMPAWKDELSVEDRWAVIVYQHTFSGHDAPHVTSEHPESVMASHAGHGPDGLPAARTPVGGPPSSSSHHH
jgi:mono/diheme cytochrome c family protein